MIRGLTLHCVVEQHNYVIERNSVRISREHTSKSTYFLVRENLFWQDTRFKACATVCHSAPNSELLEAGTTSKRVNTMRLRPRGQNARSATGRSEVQSSIVKIGCGCKISAINGWSDVWEACHVVYDMAFCLSQSLACTIIFIRASYGWKNCFKGR